jgi:carboxylesterase
MKNKILPGCEPLMFAGKNTGCLLLHGLSSSPYQLKPLAEFLNKNGYTISAPLLPGHGTSPEDLQQLSWYDWFAHTKEALFDLRKRVKKVFIAGQSMGGALALHLAAHYEIDGVIALAPGLILKKKLGNIVPFINPFMRFYYKSAGSDIKADVNTLSYNKIPLHSIAQLLQLFKHLRQDLTEIYAPTLIMYSSQDHVVDPQSAKIIYDTIPAKDKRILELKNSYHIISLDLEKEKVFQEIKNFIQQLTS